MRKISFHRDWHPKRPPPLLRRRSSVSPWAQFGLRIAVLLALLIFILAVHWFERANFRDSYDGSMSFSDVIYFTMISATTTGYGDIVPVSERARLFDALVVTPIRIFFLLILAGTAYTFVLKKTWSNWVMKRLQKTLTGHIVVAGYGISGAQAVNELIARGEPVAQIVVIDCDPVRLEEAESLGCSVMEGDATRDATLVAARIDQARAAIVSAGRDDTSILICLTARHLGPGVPISVVVRATDNEFPARAAGATTVINPPSFAGLLMASSVEGPSLADYLADLVTQSGDVRLVERAVRAEEVGKPLADLPSGLGVRILRDGVPISFPETRTTPLDADDRLIEIVPAAR